MGKTKQPVVATRHTTDILDLTLPPLPTIGRQRYEDFVQRLNQVCATTSHSPVMAMLVNHRQECKYMSETYLISSRLVVQRAALTTTDNLIYITIMVALFLSSAALSWDILFFGAFLILFANFLWDRFTFSRERDGALFWGQAWGGTSLWEIQPGF